MDAAVLLELNSMWESVYMIKCKLQHIFGLSKESAGLRNSLPSSSELGKSTRPEQPNIWTDPRNGADLVSL